jgi:hypothetical protein
LRPVWEATTEPIEPDQVRNSGCNDAAAVSGTVGERSSLLGPHFKWQQWVRARQLASPAHLQHRSSPSYPTSTLRSSFAPVAGLHRVSIVFHTYARRRRPLLNALRCRHVRRACRGASDGRRRFAGRPIGARGRCAPAVMRGGRRRRF